MYRLKIKNHPQSNFLKRKDKRFLNTMIKFLLKHLIRDYENRENPDVRGAVGRLSGIVGIVCNAILCIGKFLIGAVSGSVSIMADAVNNLSDATSAIVTLIGFRLSKIPPDERHPFGHARFEYLSGLAVAAMVLLIGVELLESSIEKIIHPQAVAYSLPLVLVLLGSILVKLWLAGFNKQLGVHINSTALLATAADSRNDVISTAAVLVAATIEYFTSMRIDGYMGSVVAVFIICSGISLGKETISPLLGESVSPELQQKIASIAESEPMVLGYHDLMVHDYGPGQRFGSIHVEMDSREDPLICHEIIDDMERLCLEKFNVHLVIHYDPVIVGDQDQDFLHELACDTVEQLDSRLKIHDFRMVKGREHTNLIFDMVLPHDLQNQKADIESALEQAFAALHREKFYLVITYDLEAFNQS